VSGHDGLGHLWSGWRLSYIEAVTDDPAPLRPDASGSLFERILAMDDAAGFIVHRGRACSVLLNAYPYTNGHLLVVPNHAVAELRELDDDTHAELWELVRDGVAALQRAYGCDGVNVGANLGAAAGAGVPDHLHVHVLARWAGDTNFMTSIAEVRVMPEAMSSSWARVRDAWPV
jgi:ATP adenylyltransferase